MGAALNLDELYLAAAEASERVMTAREDACAKAVGSIRAVERRIQSAIAGDSLRGMANLYLGAPNGVAQGVRVVGGELAHVRDAILRFGREALVIDRHGVLMVFSLSETGEFSSGPVADEGLQAQDLDAVLGTARYALERHVARADRTAANYGRILALSGAIASILEG